MNRINDKQMHLRERCSSLPRMCRHRELFAVLFDNEKRGKRVVQFQQHVVKQCKLFVTAITIKQGFLSRVRYGAVSINFQYSLLSRM